MQILVEGGRRVETVRTENVEETLSINAPADLEPRQRRTLRPYTPVSARYWWTNRTAIEPSPTAER